MYCYCYSCMSTWMYHCRILFCRCYMCSLCNRLKKFL